MRQFSSNAWPVLSAMAVDYVLLKNAPLSPVYAYRDSRTQLEKAIVAYIDYLQPPNQIKTKRSEPCTIQDSDRSDCQILIFI